MNFCYQKDKLFGFRVGKKSILEVQGGFPVKIVLLPVINIGKKMKDFATILRGERVRLEVIEPTNENAEMIYDAVVENREYLMKFLDFALPNNTKTSKDSLKYLKDVFYSTVKHAYSIFTTDEYIGQLGTFDLDDKNKSVEIGYWIIESATHKGLLTESIRLVEDEMFDGDGVNRIQIVCDVDNVASANVAKRNSYKFEGEMRESRFSEMKQKFVNTYLFSKLKSEWNKY